MTTSVNETKAGHRPTRMACPGVRQTTESRDDRIGGRALSWPKPRQSTEDEPEPTIERGRE